MNYRELKELIAGYELYQQTKLKSQAAGVFKDALTRGMCNGEVQFASIENYSKDASEDENLPIVIGVGINYGQQNKPSPNFFYQHLRDKKGHATMEDKPGSKMREMMDLTFDEYAAYPKPWYDRKLAASQNLIVPQKNPKTGKYEYILIATNFCPFLTALAWQNKKYWEPYRAELLVQLDGKFTHLDDLEVLLREKALWVAHGLGSEVPILFRLWQKQIRVNRWLMTCNLNPRPTTKKCIENIASKEMPERPIIPSDVLDQSTDS
jgi:hypothetical protein